MMDSCPSPNPGDTLRGANIHGLSMSVQGNYRGSWQPGSDKLLYMGKILAYNMEAGVLYSEAGVLYSMEHHMQMSQQD